MEEKNYITPSGYQALQQELQKLWSEERPKITEIVSWAAGNGDRSENGDYIYGKKRLREIDKRIRFLTKRIEGAEVIDPAEQSGEEVRFGATVTVLDECEVEKRYSIVGTDEVDLARGHISWRSPVARALLRRKEGDLVTVQTPRGEQDLEILRVEYCPLGCSGSVIQS
ncbi:transcription elongation factor GreB [bacterium]|nr:transcription elongation factor GreB [bacterium]